MRIQVVSATFVSLVLAAWDVRVFADEFALYNLAVTNNSRAVRLIVLGTSPSGESHLPTVLVPADGLTRVTSGSVLIVGDPDLDPDATLTIYDGRCRLLERVEIRSGKCLLTLDPAGSAALTVLDAWLPDDSLRLEDSALACPGRAPA